MKRTTVSPRIFVTAAMMKQAVLSLLAVRLATLGPAGAGKCPRDRERGATVAFLICDSGLKYLSTDLFPDDGP